ncbi:hypothetical protein GCM10023085_65210 [Actinomadura viridis]|uniref:Aminoglycoside phosphotransferase domain-containing protein n=1 Tax=Actinomadura viridis TaxID=58110 RepID=A0A931GMC9_9ACTN|nr:phosphotransferase [Actinomadura viridis]MBG6093063.1 hypothetical protein [Actinomadura viridis]
MTPRPPRIGWAELPRETRAAVEACAGSVTEVDRVEMGERSDIASVLDTEAGKVFAKGVPAADRQAAWLENEARINPYVAGLAPPLRWRVEAGGWLVLGFEYIEGRHVVYSPGSGDMAKLAAVLKALQEIPCPDVVYRRAEWRWKDFTDRAETMAGEAMIHADLNPGNVLITEDRAYLVDWAGTCRGAGWVELAMLIPRLIGHGHGPAEAEEWAAQFTPWRDAAAEDVDLFVAAESIRWDKVAADWPYPRILLAANTSRQWKEWRRGR